MDLKKFDVPFGTLYDFNKQIVLKEGAMPQLEINKVIPKIEDWFNWTLDGYAMLLCLERYDFTVFHLYEKENLNPPAIAARELIDVLKNRGTILSIEKDIEKMNKAWEILLQLDDNAYAYYLFGCDDWVIEC